MNGVELSPWAGMDGCVATQVLFAYTAGAPPAAPGAPACRVNFYTPSSNTITVVGMTNGPGGNNTASAEELGRNTIGAD